MSRSALKLKQGSKQQNHKQSARPTKKIALSPLANALRDLFRRPPIQRPAPVSVPVRNKIRFESLEPRVLMDANPAALTIAGAIDVPGEQDHYEFTLQEKTRVVFDSLTNNSSLTWQLDGPAGQLASRNFAATDANSFLPAFELDAGKYSLLVDGAGDAIGSYELRVVDASTAADLTPSTPVTGTLEGGKKTDVYRFSATAGDKFFFDGLTETGGGSAYWRLIDPYGKQELGISQRIGADTDTFAVQRTGVYLLTVEGSNSNAATLAYSFNLRSVSDSNAALTLDTLTTAQIDQPGKAANFQFTLNQATTVLFDGLTNSDQYFWSLSGPDGQTVARRALNDSTAFASNYDTRQWLQLVAGNYALSVDASLATTGQAAFRLLTQASAQSLTLNSVISATLDQAQGAALYKVTLRAGDKLYLDGQAASNGAVSWRFLNPYGDLVSSGSSLIAAGSPFTATIAGDYWLLLDGAPTNNPAQTVSVQFALNLALDVAALFNLGDAVSGSIATAGQTTVYSFTLSAATQLIFDSQTNRADILWSLVGPRGVEVTERRFDRSDSPNGSTVLSIPVGSYRLSVRGVGSAAGAYAFRLLDAAASAALTLGTALSGTLTPGNATQLYRVTLAAGDRLAFTSTSVTGGAATWRLIDAYGRDVLGQNNLATNRSVFLLTTAGSYTLVLEGGLANTAVVDFNVLFSFVDNLPQPALPAGDPLALDTVVAGTFVATGATKIYRFTLAQDSVLVFDAQTNNTAITWRLVGPRGQEALLSLFASDAQYMDPTLILVAGEYALTVNAYFGTGDYAFQLLDTANFPLLTLGQQIDTVRAPSNSTIGYQFTASVGDVFQISLTLGDGSWRVLDPYGKVVAERFYYYQYNTQSITIPALVSGAYTLINEGNYYQTGSTSIRFQVDRQSQQIAALVLNDVVTGQLAGSQEQHAYTFTLTAPTTFTLDRLESPTTRADNIIWLLTGSGGISRSVYGWEVITLGAGQYTLTVQNNYFTRAQTYQFRVLTRDSAMVITPGTPVTGALSPDGAAQLYRFNGSQGQRFYFDGLSYTYDANWQLTDAYGRNVSYGNIYYDQANITLPTSGEYLFRVYHDFRYDSASQRNFSFNLIPETTTADTAVLDADTTGSISRPNERVTYHFTLTAPTTILVDTWTSTAGWAGGSGAVAASKGSVNQKVEPWPFWL